MHIFKYIFLVALTQGEECQSTPALLEAGLQPQVNSSSLGMIAEHTLLESCTRLSISLEQNGLFQNNTSHSSSTSHSSKYSHNCSGPKMTLEELKAVNAYAESTRSLSYLPQVSFVFIFYCIYFFSSLIVFEILSVSKCK